MAQQHTKLMESKIYAALGKIMSEVGAIEKG